MNIDALFFAIVSFATVLLYLSIAGAAGWTQRKVYDIETAYWKALEAFVWSLGMILLRGSPDVNMWAIIPIFPTALIYGFISEQPTMLFDLTGNTPLTSTQVAVLASVGSVVALYFVVAFALDPYKSTLPYRLIPLVLFVTWLLIWLGVNKASERSETKRQMGGGISFTFGKDGAYQNFPTITTQYDYSLHVHHWIIAVIGFLLCLSPEIHGQIVSGIFWGVFCQSAASYGIMPPTNIQKSFTYGTERVPLVQRPDGTYRGL